MEGSLVKKRVEEEEWEIDVAKMVLNLFFFVEPIKIIKQ